MQETQANRLPLRLGRSLVLLIVTVTETERAVRTLAFLEIASLSVENECGSPHNTPVSICTVRGLLIFSPRGLGLRVGSTNWLTFSRSALRVDTSSRTVLETTSKAEFISYLTSRVLIDRARRAHALWGNR